MACRTPRWAAGLDGGEVPVLERLRRCAVAALQRRLCAQASLYWFTNTISTSFRPYYEHARGMREPVEAVRVPTALAVFPHDLSRPPRSWAERTYKPDPVHGYARRRPLRRHEEPELLGNDLTAFSEPCAERTDAHAAAHGSGAWSFSRSFHHGQLPRLEASRRTGKRTRPARMTPAAIRWMAMKRLWIWRLVESASGFPDCHLELD